MTPIRRSNAVLLKRQEHIQGYASRCFDRFFNVARDQNVKKAIKDYILSSANLLNISKDLYKLRETSETFDENEGLSEFLSRTFEYMHMGKLPIKSRKL